MRHRYFNLKQGSPNVMGGIIRVDSEADLEHRLKDFLDDNEITREEFRLLKKDKWGLIYEISIPNAEFSAGIGDIPSLAIKSVAPGYVRNGRVKKLQLRVTNEGQVKVYDAGRYRIYLTEISEREAKRSKDEAESWRAQQHYVFS
ncbi:hypothetical protein HYX15_01245 [Candidatus Woesearchaeota archaeon]|nr:hypothetical protein [Candidatus Woesearchaeota archaeon]